jgi:predicted permease
MLVVSEVAVSVALLVGATLLARSFGRLVEPDIDARADRVLTASINLTLGRTLSSAQQNALVERVVERIRRLPAVSDAGVASSLPPAESRMALTLARTDTLPSGYLAVAVPATPGYASVMGLPLLSGRFFSPADDAQHPPVLVLSRKMAVRFFGEDDVIGRTLSIPVLRDGATTMQEASIIGVIDDVRYSGLERPSSDAVYRSFAQQPMRSGFVVVRTEAPAVTLARAVRGAIAEVDPQITVGRVAPLSDVVADAASVPRLRTFMLAMLAILAVSLAAVGVYGLIAYGVAQRTAEIALRIALGATSGGVESMIVSGSLTMALAGIAIGLAAAAAGSRYMSALLFGIAPTDLVSYALAAFGVLAVTAIAAWLPSRRAARIPPQLALRAE